MSASNNVQAAVNQKMKSIQKEYVPESKMGKIFIGVGLVCFLTAIVLIILPDSIGEFEMPMWIASAVIAGISTLSAIYHAFVPWYSHESASISCLQFIRNETFQTAVIFSLLAVLLKLKPKYKDYRISMSPEIILVVVAYICWMIHKFHEI